ncbi:hypothetical protein NC651_032904 [Populus alba x Populus x berolinensis]|nr:hypothetical protein NC651_032904 [Populus alba x Populus x berolinensis]
MLVLVNLTSYLLIYVHRWFALRSGLAWKHSIDVGVGVIDDDYRGPLKVGDGIAQLILEKIVTSDVMQIEDLDATERCWRRIDGGLNSKIFGFGKGLSFVNEDTCNKAIYIYK